MAKRSRLLEAASLACVLCVFGLPALVGPSGRLTAAPRPYLCTVGPAPLRYQSPHPVAQPFLLASLHQRDGPPTASNSRATNSTTAAAESAVLTNSATPTLIAQISPRAPPRPAACRSSFCHSRRGRKGSSTTLIDPQLLLQYLSPASTNAAHAKPTWPAFVPPVPAVVVAPSPSSRATYERR